MKKFISPLILFFIAGFSRAQVNITVTPVFDSDSLILNNKKYINKNGDTLTIESFKFYLSNFSVYSKGKWTSLSETYFLVDAENKNSLQFHLNASMPSLDSISFYIGVDSIKNVSGALDGALDPSLGMFWAWNTGYINAKLEGKSNACKTVHHAYEFHVGGYLYPHNASRRVSLKTNGNRELHLIADAAKWFTGNTVVQLGQFNSVVTPSLFALKIADNYKYMFSIK